MARYEWRHLKYCARCWDLEGFCHDVCHTVGEGVGLWRVCTSDIIWCAVRGVEISRGLSRCLPHGGGGGEGGLSTSDVMQNVVQFHFGGIFLKRRRAQRVGNHVTFHNEWITMVECEAFISIFFTVIWLSLRLMSTPCHTSWHYSHMWRREDTVIPSHNTSHCTVYCR